jgi:hypothetical protein
MIVWFIGLLGEARRSADRELLERSAVVDAGCPLFGFRSVTQGGVNASGLRQISVEAEESPWRLEVWCV